MEYPDDSRRYLEKLDRTRDSGGFRRRWKVGGRYREGGDAFRGVFSQGGSRTLEKTDAKLKVSSVRTGSFPFHPRDDVIVDVSLSLSREYSSRESWRTVRRN